MEIYLLFKSLLFIWWYTTNVNYQLRFGNEVVIQQNTYREVLKQFQFPDKQTYQHVKHCDRIHENDYYLSFLNESNYNNETLAGYVREDLERKSVFSKPLEQEENLLYNFEHDYTINTTGLTLLETNPITTFNLNTTEYKFGLPHGGGYYFAYEQIGDLSDMINSTKMNIDGVRIDLKAFSIDQGVTFYRQNN